MTPYLLAFNLFDFMLYAINVGLKLRWLGVHQWWRRLAAIHFKNSTHAEMPGSNNIHSTFGSIQKVENDWAIETLFPFLSFELPLPLILTNNMNAEIYSTNGKRSHTLGSFSKQIDIGIILHLKSFSNFTGDQKYDQPSSLFCFVGKSG